jgi:leucyl aminopeptidase
LTLHITGKISRKLTDAIKRGRIVAESVAIGRDLVNEPPSDLYPQTFAAFAKKTATKVGLKIKILKPEQLKKMGMNLLLGVGQGSTLTPRLVHLSYTPAKATKKKPIVLVGKGITFDSGGLSLKPGASMVDMKMDMGGAGAVLGAMNAVAQLKPNVPVHGILALAENMPSGCAIRPGDVIKGASGRTVEINNTDAEGRLVLADALHYAVGLKPAKIIDLATLTGAVMVALGPHTVGCFSNDDTLANEILGSAEATGESFWRLPLNELLKDQLKSDIADTKNTGERWGGSITAALFLQEFVGGTTWAHLDIAGPAMSGANSGYLTKGGSGVAIATLVDHIC